MINDKRLDDILKERKMLLDTKTLLIKENRSIITEGRLIRRALREAISYKYKTAQE